MDLFYAISDFFAGADLPKSWTNTFFVLVPKVPNPTSFKDLRPISLCNSLNMIIAKILTARLACSLPNIISPEQNGFVTSRMIQHNIPLGQELLISIRKNVRGSSLVFKLDIQKARDSVSWLALVTVMKSLVLKMDWYDMEIII